MNPQSGGNYLLSICIFKAGKKKIRDRQLFTENRQGSLFPSPSLSLAALAIVSPLSLSSLGCFSKLTVFLIVFYLFLISFWSEGWKDAAVGGAGRDKVSPGVLCFCLTTKCQTTSLYLLVPSYVCYLSFSLSVTLSPESCFCLSLCFSSYSASRSLCFLYLSLSLFLTLTVSLSLRLSGLEFYSVMTSGHWVISVDGFVRWCVSVCVCVFVCAEGGGWVIGVHNPCKPFVLCQGLHHSVCSNGPLFVAENVKDH